MTERDAVDSPVPDASGAASPWEFAAIVAVVVAADLMLYRGAGYTGVAAFLLAAPPLLWIGGRAQVRATACALLGVMLVVLAGRLVWYGSPLAVAVGFVWLYAWATARQGRTPYFVAVLRLFGQSIAAGGRSLATYLASARAVGPRVNSQAGLNVVLPAAALFGFGALFTLANPDAVSWVVRQANALGKAFYEWFEQFDVWEVVVWGVAAWLAAGVLRPIDRFSRFAASWAAARAAEAEQLPESTEAPLFVAYFNTLVAVIALFGGYLIYEFYSLGTREFPPGFYYAGYAHQGAAWLTVALAAATLILSAVFSGRALQDPRIGRLRWLAWAWSLQNLLLAVAVYNRLFIYIDYNGLTRMRVVGLFGVSLVVVGFLLVVWKVAVGRGFAWLVQRQLWALACTVYLFALTPVDALAASYNVRRILAGERSACMQIGVQPLDLEGVLTLPPLLDCGVPEIEQGVAALLAERRVQLLAARDRRRESGWTAFQLSDGAALARLEALRSRWSGLENSAARRAAITRFHDYAYQWY